MGYKCCKQRSYLSIVTEDEEVIKNIDIKINTVKQYLINGGAASLKDEAELSSNVVACIAIGVNDLLNNKAGDTSFSPAFNISFHVLSFDPSLTRTSS